MSLKERKETSDVRLFKPAQETWQAAKEILKKKLSEPNFGSWIQPLSIISLSPEEAVFAVPTEFARGAVVNGKFDDLVAKALSQILNELPAVKVIVDPSVQPTEYVPALAGMTIMPDTPPSEEELDTTSGASPKSNNTGRPPAPAGKSGLNSKYTFSTFVVGSHNRFCHSAALSVAQKPGHSYNPLFLYGGVGLGKTHIMQAIGHEVLRHNPHAIVRYITCERFINDMINSIRDDRMVEFRKRYRQVDVLLVDDIQFIQGKESTQQEFFHTFNALRENGSQIVLSSDKPPKDISHLEERLRSRFEWGLITDIQVPDLETRIAILRKKCEIDGLKIPDDLLQHIASVFTSNIRELEGALIRVHAYANMTGAELSVSSLADILQPPGQSNLKPNLTLDLIIETVCKHYQIEPSEMRSTKRSQDLTLPRHIAMYLAHQLMQMSFPRIGQAFANRKHTSALYGHSRIKEGMIQDPQLAQQVTLLSRKLL